MNQVATAQATDISPWMDRPDIRQRIGSALAGWMKPDDFLAQLLIAFKDPDIAVCDAASQFAAAHTCAALQLLPTLDQVALIPRNCKGGKVVTVMPQWQGYKALMERHPDVTDVTAKLVHVTDDFQWDETTNQMVHRFDPLSEKREFDKDFTSLKGGYLKVTYRDPHRPPKYHFVTRADIIRRRKCAETRVVWDKWPREQALKSIYRDGYQRRIVPIDPLVNQRLETLTATDDEALGNDPSRVDATTQPALLPAAPTVSRSSHIAGQLAPPPPVPENPPQPEKKPPAKKAPAKKKPPKDPPPEVPDSLAEYATAIHAATDAEEVQKIWFVNVDQNKNLSHEEFEDGTLMRDWKLRQLGVEPPKPVQQQELL